VETAHSVSLLAASFSPAVASEPMTHYSTLTGSLTENLNSGAVLEQGGLAATRFNPARNALDPTAAKGPPRLPSRQADSSLNPPRLRRLGTARPDPLTGLSQNSAWLTSEKDAATPAMTRSTRAGLPYPGRLLSYVPGAPLRFDPAVRQWQERMRERGWSIAVDGLYGPSSARICRQFQQEKGLAVDGIVGPDTWAATFRSDNLTNPRPNPGAPLRINQRGLNLIKHFEGLVLTAYRDPVGIWTIGYGHTGPEVGPGDRITAAQAEALLRQDLVRFENGVRNLVKVPLNSNQFSALVSFTFNVGTGAFANSTMLRRLNQRDYRGAADQFSRWVYGGGRVLPGLVRRRNEERALFLAPV